MHPSPLIIDSYFVKKIQFELKPGFEEDFNREIKPTASPKLSIGVGSGKSTDDDRHWWFELKIDTEDDTSENDFPYKFSIILAGFFRVDENFPAEQADLLAQVNAPSVLYSAAREFLASVTGRSPYPAILLPSISFVPESKEAKPKRKSVSKNTKSKK